MRAPAAAVAATEAKVSPPRSGALLALTAAALALPGLIAGTAQAADGDEFTFEYRNLPPVDPTGLFEQVEKYAREQLEPAMRAVQPHASIEFTQICAAPAFDGVEQEAITQLVRALTQNQVRRKVAYGTEAGLFQLAGVPSIVCGPGDIEQAHKPNEYVAIEQIEACESFTRKLIASLVTTHL